MSPHIPIKLFTLLYKVHCKNITMLNLKIKKILKIRKMTSLKQLKKNVPLMR